MAKNALLVATVMHNSMNCSRSVSMVSMAISTCYCEQLQLHPLHNGPMIQIQILCMVLNHANIS